MNRQTVQTLIAMVGLPRSGKSTIVRELTRRYHAPIVKKDDIRLALHGQRYEALAEPFVQAIAITMIRSLFLSGHQTVIADETHYSKYARQAVSNGPWQTVFYLVNTSPKTCIERAHMTGQPDLEPVIERMAARFEPLTAEERRYEDVIHTLVDVGRNEALHWRSGPDGYYAHPTLESGVRAETNGSQDTYRTSLGE